MQLQKRDTFCCAFKTAEIQNNLNLISIIELSFNSAFLPAATKLGQGNIFIGVCQEFCSRGRGGGLVPGVWSQGGCLPRGVSNFSGGLQFFWGGGSPIFCGGSPSFQGVSNFSAGGLQFFRGSPIFWGGVSNFLGCLQFFGGSPIFWGISNFGGGLQFFGGGVHSNFFLIQSFFLIEIFFLIFFLQNFFWDASPPRIWSLSGRYASYWNAFLFLLK